MSNTIHSHFIEKVDTGNTKSDWRRRACPWRQADCAAAVVKDAKDAQAYAGKRLKQALVTAPD